MGDCDRTEPGLMGGLSGALPLPTDASGALTILGGAALMPLPHRGVGGLDVTGKPRRIKQRISTAIARQFGLD